MRILHVSFGLLSGVHLRRKSVENSSSYESYFLDDTHISLIYYIYQTDMSEIV
jgi:hypothetical protein